MLRIQVLGHGMIPRGYGLAPHRELFWADKLLIQTILTDAHLQINMQHPEDGILIKVTRTNLDKLWNSYSDKYNTNSTSNKISTHVIEKPKTLIDKNHEKMENKKEIPSVIVKEPEKKEKPEAVKDVKSEIEKTVEEKFTSEVEVVKDLENKGFHVASDKEFNSVVEKAINDSSKNDHKKDKPKNETMVKANGLKPIESPKENENKKDELNKSETLIRPINNPENK